MKKEQFEEAQNIIEELQPLYDAKGRIIEHITDGRTFSLHESYFDADFVANLKSQIDNYIDRKIDKLEKRFEEL